MGVARRVTRMCRWGNSRCHKMQKQPQEMTKFGFSVQLHPLAHHPLGTIRLKLVCRSVRVQYLSCRAFHSGRVNVAPMDPSKGLRHNQPGIGSMKDNIWKHINWTERGVKSRVEQFEVIKYEQLFYNAPTTATTMLTNNSMPRACK